MLVNSEGRAHHKQKLNISFHKRGLCGQNHVRVTLTNQGYQVNNLLEHKRIKTDHIKLYPDEIRTTVNAYLEKRKVDQLAWKDMGSDAPENKDSEDPRMTAIMTLVNSTSKQMEVFRQLITVWGQAVFV